MLNKEIIYAVIRHALTILGGFFVATGKIDASNADTIVGSLTALAGVGLSIKHKIDNGSSN